MKRHWALASCLILAATVAGCQASVPTVAGKALSGVWYSKDRDFKPNSEQKFSWGESPIAVNATLSIDALDGTGDLDLPVLGWFHVIQLEPVGENLYRMRFSRERRPDAEYMVHHDPVADTIWFSDLKFYEAGTDKVMPGGGRLIPAGPENVYKRVGGPPR